MYCRIFNELHLRLRNERVGSVTTYLYYMPFKLLLTVINIVSCYYSLYKYAKYFAKRYAFTPHTPYFHMRHN